MKRIYGIWKEWVLTGVMATMTFAGSISTMTAEAQIVENGQYMSAEGAPIVGTLEKGIMVTKYQNRASESAGGIDRTKVKANGVLFAMVRLGYHSDMDPYYSMSINGATAQGTKVGALFYTQTLDMRATIDEANYVLALVKDYPTSYPVAYDVESKVLLDSGLTKQQITDQISALCSVIMDAGYRPVVYASNTWLTEHVDTSQIPYDIWYAKYGTTDHGFKNQIIWQCDQYGKVDGVMGDVTIELSSTDYSTLIPADSQRKIGGQWYYMKNYVKQVGWMQVGDKWYYIDSNDAMVHDTALNIGGRSYTFGPDGAVQ